MNGGGAQNEKSGPGGISARNERFIMRSTKNIVSFRGCAQNEKSSPGGTTARVERLKKEKY